VSLSSRPRFAVCQRRKSCATTSTGGHAVGAVKIVLKARVPAHRPFWILGGDSENAERSAPERQPEDAQYPRTACLAGEKVGALISKACLKAFGVRQDNGGHRKANLMAELPHLIPKNCHGCTARHALVALPLVVMYLRSRLDGAAAANVTEA
jgi:hypothetical protein